MVKITLQSYFIQKYFANTLRLYDVLLFLNANGRKTELMEVREKFKDKISKPSLHSILFDLEKHDYIEILQMKDRRKKIISITEFGIVLKRDLEQIFNRYK